MSTRGAEGVRDRVQCANCVRSEVIPDEMSMVDTRSMVGFISYSTPQASRPFARFNGLCSTLSNMMALVGPTTDSCMAETPVVLKRLLRVVCSKSDKTTHPCCARVHVPGTKTVAVAEVTRDTKASSFENEAMAPQYSGLRLQSSFIKKKRRGELHLRLAHSWQRLRPWAVMW
jgi:hypothetical protein